MRLIDPQMLPELAPSIRERLVPLCLPKGRFRRLLAERLEALVVVALDERGALGWAAAEPDGLLGCYVAPRRRRSGIGRRLVQALWPAARKRWPEAEWHYGVRPGSPGEAFWRSMSRQLTAELRRVGTRKGRAA